MSEANNAVEFIELAADIVAAYVGNNAVSAAELTALIGDVHKALVGVALGMVEKPVEALVPAVSIKKSVQNDFIICLEDGKKFKSLKRHLRTKYDLSPEDYRAKWGLSADYPMVAPSYAETRSNLAKASGLGQQRRKTSPKSEPKRGRKAAAN